VTKYKQGWAKGFKKSPRAQEGEWYDSGWEVQYMQELELDPMAKRWTRHHGLRIRYRKWWGGQGYFEPDFLVEIEGGEKEIREVKGTHLLTDLNTKRKFQAGEAFCRQRGMVFKVVTKTHVDPSDWSLRQGVKVEESRGDTLKQSPTEEPLKAKWDFSGVYQALIWVALFLLVLYMLMG
jgi:hypothetical protein